MTTPADLVFTAVMRAEAAASVAIILVLLIRAPVRRLFGAELAYRLWAVVPATALAGMFPTLPEFLAGQGAGVLSMTPPEGMAPPLLQLWIAGGLVVAAVMTLCEYRFRRLAVEGRAGPAVMGVFWPRMVTPSDYDQRYTPQEQALIRRHERTHIAHRHPHVNLFLAGMQALSWFNPLVHLAAASVRMDQELACDAAVLEAAPGSRRLYAETLVKAHLDTPSSLLACAWAAAGRHPLETRVAMLARPPLALPQYLRGMALLAIVATITAFATWTLGPRWTNEPRFVWPAEQGGEVIERYTLEVGSHPFS